MCLYKWPRTCGWSLYEWQTTRTRTRIRVYVNVALTLFGVFKYFSLICDGRFARWCGGDRLGSSGRRLARHGGRLPEVGAQGSRQRRDAACASLQSASLLWPGGRDRLRGRRHTATPRLRPGHIGRSDELHGTGFLLGYWGILSDGLGIAYVHRVSKKLCKIVFAITLSNFHQNVILFCTLIGQRIGLCKMDLFSTSPKSRQRPTVFQIAT